MKKPALAPLVTVAALVLAFAGGATAKSVVDGHDIKKNSITGKQVKNGSLRLKDVNAKDATSLHGKDGRDGVPGASGFGAPPTGTTLTGGGDLVFDAAAADKDSEYYVPLGFTTATALTIGAGRNLWFSGSASAAGGEANAGCAGTSDAPAAPPGQLCVYIATAGNIKPASASLKPGIGVGGPQAVRSGFVVDALSLAAGQSQLRFTWAYTAP